MKRFRRLFSASLAVAIFVLQGPSVLAAPGDLDRTFGGDGNVLTDFHCLRTGSGIPTLDFRGITAMALTPDNKIVAAGTCARLEGTDTTYRIVLARYNVDGTLDRTFHWDGAVDDEFFDDDSGREAETFISAVAVQPNRQILVGGRRVTYDAAGRTAENDYFLARFSEDGSLDTTFGLPHLGIRRGWTVNRIGVGVSAIESLALQADGKIVAAGYAYQADRDAVSGGRKASAIARYRDNGELDFGFGTNGSVIGSLAGGDATFTDISVQESDGKIIAVGVESAHTEPRIARYLSDGALDRTSFAGYGMATVFTPNFGAVTDVALQPDGRIVLLSDNSRVLRLAENGHPDDAFNLPDFSAALGTSTVLHDVAMTPSGKIVAAGRGSVGQFTVVRLQSNGAYDEDFAERGWIQTRMHRLSTDEGAGTVLVQEDGKIVAGGFVDMPDGYGRTSAKFALARYEGERAPIPGLVLPKSQLKLLTPTKRPPSKFMPFFLRR